MNQPIKVGITGQGGFIGSHLFNFLGTKMNEIERVSFEKNYFENEIAMQNFVSSCDIIVHIAAINRHEDQKVIYDTNISLVKKLINACEITNSTPKIIFSSSTQEKKNNIYGKSKIDGRKLLENWARKKHSKLCSLLIPNVFGPFCKPNYNSFIATFCHKLITNEETTIIKDSIVDLIYINKLSEIFYDEIINDGEEIKSYIVSHTTSRKVSDILEILKKYKKQYFDNGKVPNVPVKSFELDLFNTFTSFIPKTYFPKKFIKYSDNRGLFVEIIKTNIGGQTSYSTTLPGITRGNHYHTRKIERFSVISGRASIKLRKIGCKEVFEYILDGNEPAYVDMPIWHTHNITNIGDKELITLFWINEPYNSEDADTYFVNV